MTDQCAFCGHAHLVEKSTRYFHQAQGEVLIMDDVPCLECAFCREQYFDAAVLKLIENEHEEILHHGKIPQAMKPVAMESFSVLHQR